MVRMMFDLCVSSGYGRCRMAAFLSEHGIKNRKGENWHEATVGAILHNPLYKGVLRSGETWSEPFEELQIIRPEVFELAQSLMNERTNAYKECRTVPLKTTGQSLVSGNIFCGHCGGRLTLTTNGKITRTADGTPLKRKRIRYVCYNKTRHRAECDGQTGYTMHILDQMITDILHQVFDKMKAATPDMLLDGAARKQVMSLESELQRAKAENIKANKEYDALKSELLKAVQGKSKMSIDILSEVMDGVRQRIIDSSGRVTSLTAELENENARMSEMQAELDRITTWSGMFDQSDMATKKMICSYIIKRVKVFRDVEFNINVEQFLNGIDSIPDLPLAQ